jgi:hypothetical protein
MANFKERSRLAVRTENEVMMKYVPKMMLYERMRIQVYMGNGVPMGLDFCALLHSCRDIILVEEQNQHG